jgi:outer membrane protein assembly factor BamB
MSAVIRPFALRTCAATFTLLASLHSGAQPRALQRPGLLVFVGMPAEQVVAAIPAERAGIVQIVVEKTGNPTEVTARPRMQHLSPGGRVTVMELNAPLLPYCDNSVNTLVLAGPTELPRAELLRVLAPRGVLVRADGDQEVKPWAEAMDEWTHNLHSAGNNAVAADTMVGPPDRLRWIGAPDHIRHHNFLASFSCLVSARGRLFTIADEGSLVSPYLPASWVLSCRDAFNGITLWKKAIPDWAPNLRNFRSGPAEIARRLVAVDDEVFVTLGYEAPVSVLDAATGEEKAVLPDTGGAEEILVVNGVVLMVAGSPKAQLWDWSGEQRDFTTGPKHKRALIAADVATYKVLWEQRNDQTATVLPMSLTADGNRGYCVNARGPLAFDLRTGKPLWQAEEPVAVRRQAKFAPTVVVHEDVLLYADRLPRTADAETFYSGRAQKYQERYRQLRAYPGRLRAYDAATGNRLWECPAGESFHTPTDVIVIDDTVWYTSSPAMLEGNYEEGRELRTGRVVRKIKSPPDINHGRCYRNKATIRYLLGGKNGLDFIDPTGRETRHVPAGLRGTCQLGVLPCNGLVYLPPHACTCESERKFNGFLALAQGKRLPYPDPAPYSPRLRRGPASGKVGTAPETPAPGEWPTFRHDAARTGCAATRLPEKLDVLWERPVGRRPTAPVCAGGTLYVAAREDHVLLALDAATGEPRWKYRTAGRIDSPPTVEAGLVVFGCRDGWLRCLRAADGTLVWRFRGAAEERQIVVREQLESVWPLHGATLVKDDKAYFAAGRASVLDGGITVFCLDLVSGKVLAKTRLHDDGGEKKRGHAAGANDALLDVLSFVGSSVTMRHVCLTPELAPAKPVDHLVGATGLLDDSGFHRSYWGYATKVKRNVTGNQSAAGTIMTIDGRRAYAYARRGQYYIGHIKGFERHLFATDLEPEPAKLEPGSLKPRRQGSFTRVMRQYEKRGIATHWSAEPPVLVKGMTVAGEKLVVAGPAFELHPSSFLLDPTGNRVRLDTAPDDTAAARAAIDKAHCGLTGKNSPRLCIYAKRTGELQSNNPLPAAPVFDGVMAAARRLYICREDGVVMCLGERDRAD